MPDVVSRIKEIGWTTAPIADLCSTFGFVRWTKLCEKEGLRPVYGVTLNVTEQLGVKKPVMDRWTFLAIDDLRDLHELIYTATSNPGREPSLTYPQAAYARGVVKITGEATLLEHVPVGEALLYVGLSPASPRGLVRAAAEADHRFVATSVNRYPRAEDKELYRVVMGGRGSFTQTYPQHILSDEEWSAATHAPDDIKLSAIACRDMVLELCGAKLKKAKILSPPRPKTLRQLCEEGAARVGCDLADSVYAARLDHELRMIAAKDFEDYFYIMADMMMWARDRMVVGPARGSSCGSLACYLLGITAIDPIQYGLIFERFIDTTRADLPDIDVDFSDHKRHLVFEYMDEKYGRERSARLGSVNMIKAKMAFNLAGVSLRIPQSRVKEMGNTVIKRTMGDSRASSTIEDTFTDTEVGKRFIKEFPEATIVSRMEAHPNNAAQHAAGLVLTEGPVIDYVAVDARTGGTMCDKKDAEDLNLLKIDALGLTQLSIFERCMELIGVEPRSSWLEAIPLDDQSAFDVLNRLQFSGVFQFDLGTALARLVEELVITHGGKLDNIEDIIAFGAVVRPGPLGSGVTEKWIRRRAGREPVAFEHPLLEPYLADTFGLPIYQEQIMRIGRELGDLSWDDVTALRKAMSKSLGKEYFDQFGDKWKAGAVAKGFPRDLADSFWDDMCNFGAWAFNRAHSVAYGLISYWCCWLKAHHPLEFAAATLDAQNESQKQIDILRELAREGISYVPVDVDKSVDRWVPAEVGENRQRVLVGPLTNVKGIGPKTVQQIVEARQGLRELTPSVRKKLEDARTEIDSLTPIADALAAFNPFDPDGLNIVSVPTAIADINPNGRKIEVMVLAKVMRVAPLNENEPSRVAKRNGLVFTGPVDSVNLFVRDDTGELFCKVNRYDFETLGRPLVEKARPGKSLYAIKGMVPPDFRMLWVKGIRYIGEAE